MKRAARLVFYVGPLLAWMALIFVMSTSVGEPSNSTSLLQQALHAWAPGFLATLSAYQLDRLDYVLRKLGHLTEYAGLTLLAVRAFQFGRPALRVRSFLGALLLSIAYAASDELHQRLVPGRSAVLRDVVIDTVGSVACMLGIVLWFAVKAVERRLWDLPAERVVRRPAEAEVDRAGAP